MYKQFRAFLLLIALHSMLNTGAIAQNLTASSLTDSSLTASPAEQIRFNMTFSSMWYWYEECILMNKELMKTKEIVAIYEDLTGIQAANEKAIRDAYEIKQAVCKDCVPALEKAQSDITLYKGRSKRRAKAIAISIPATLAVGIGIGLLIN